MSTPFTFSAVFNKIKQGRGPGADTRMVVYCVSFRIRLVLRQQQQQQPAKLLHRESMTTKHLIHQFKTAIHDALASKDDARTIMRAHSGKQRFPVSQSVRDLEALQATAVARHKEYA